MDEPCHVSDLHATILHLMGLDHERQTFFYKGLEERIIGTRGDVATKAIAWGIVIEINDPDLRMADAW